MIGAIVLAAGEARRMGPLKQLLPWGASTVVEQVVDTVLAAGVEEVVVVVGHRAQEVARKLANRPVRIAVNSEYSRGMSSSIRCGLQQLPEGWKGIMLVLGDQPTIPPQVLRQLTAAFSQGPQGIVVPVYGGRRGHPVIFSSKYRAELMALTKDVGARSILTAHPQDVLEVPVTSEGVLQDLNSPADYQKLHRQAFPQS